MLDSCSLSIPPSGYCDATLSDALCFVMNTELTFVLKKEDVQEVENRAYDAMRSIINNGKIEKAIDGLHKMTFLLLSAPNQLTSSPVAPTLTPETPSPLPTFQITVAPYQHCLALS